MLSCSVLFKLPVETGLEGVCAHGHAVEAGEQCRGVCAKRLYFSLEAFKRLVIGPGGPGG